MLVKLRPCKKIPEHDKKKDVREKNRIGHEKERRKETAEKPHVNYIM